MITLTLLPSGRKMAFPGATRLDEALMEAGHPLSTPCGGRGLCGKCLVKATGNLSPPSSEEKNLVAGPGFRLACRTFLEGDAEVTIEQAVPAGGEKIRGAGIRQVAIAIDMGTTTIVAGAADPATGEIIHRVSLLNPQRRFGHDVISRISAASSSHRGELVHLLHLGVSSAVRALLDDLGINEKDVISASAAGNTVMTYFLLDMDTTALGTAPYVANVRDFSPSAIPLLPGIPPAGIMPVLSAYGGGDLLGGMTLMDRHGPAGGIFFADLGTNGEMYLRTPAGRIYATSCAMGPALEGMNISRGMTASPGAITHVYRNGAGLLPVVMGEGEAMGISGTGLVDLAALLLDMGVILPSGAFGHGAGGVVPNADAGIIPLTGRVSLSRMDIRNLQLAKGACLSAARILVEESGISTGDITSVIIAGAFGENLDIDNFNRLEFLPRFPRAQYLFRGNTSLESAVSLGLDPSFLPLARELREKTRMIDLASHPRFQEVFLSSLDFPSSQQ